MNNNERILEKATEDTRFSDELLANPAKAISATIGKVVTVLEFTAEKRKVLGEVLKKASADPAFKKQLIASPKDALASAGYAAAAPPPGADARFWCFLSYVYVGDPT